jgi:RNA ligase (TIGR02306 family)
MERKLASIKKIDKITKHPNADSLEICHVGGWKVITKIGEYTEGDLAVYFEVDSFLPIKEDFEFLRKSSYKKMGDIEGFRLKTIKLRQELSQGLLLPLSILEKEDEIKIGTSKQPWGDQIQLGPYDDSIVIEEGADVTAYMCVIKYEPPVPAELSGIAKGLFPSFIPKTDEERIQNLSEEIPKWNNEYSDGFYVTEKLDGSSATFYYKDGEFGACSRNLELLETEGNTFWKVARIMDLENKMKSLGYNVSLQGELIGEGIQGNPYKIRGQKVFFFNVFNIDKYEYASSEKFTNTIKELGLEAVPIIETNFSIPSNIDEIIQYADSKSVLNPQFDREGVVIRSLDRKISFKVISNKFLLNEK